MLRNKGTDASGLSVQIFARKMLEMESLTHCALCRRPVPVGNGYVVRIDVFADPDLPPMTTEQVETMDFDATLRDLIEQMKGMSAADLQDGVHRRLEYRLCPSCHARYLSNPLGIPRDVPIGKN